LNAQNLSLATVSFINPSYVLSSMKKSESLSQEEKMFDLKKSGDTCTSCNTSVVNEKGAVKFDCPNCGKQKIIRCSKCRKIATKYICSQCNFEGPN
jgi:Zn-ribbon RNA-binding protein